MATGRMIRASISTSRKFAQLPDEFCQVLYLLLIVHADDFGMLAGDAWTVKYKAVPTSLRSEKEVDVALDSIAEVGLTERYTTGDQQVIRIVQFDDHQSGLHKRTASRFKLPDGNFPELPGDSGNVRELPAQEKRRERKRTEEKRTRTPEAPPSDVLMTYPCNGTPNTWALTEDQADAWASLYVGVDVRGECSKALAWVQANQRKSAKGMTRFLVSWLNRANDQPRSRSAATRATPAPPTPRTPTACTCGDAYRQSYDGRCVTCNGKPTEGEQSDTAEGAPDA